MTMNFGFSAAMISRATCGHSIVAARVVADEPGIGAMLAHDADLGLLREGVFEPVGQPVGLASPMTTIGVVASGFFCEGPGARE